MGEISSDLQTFKDKVDGKTGNMSNVCNDLQTKCEELANVSTSTKSEISTYYNGSQQVTVTRKFTKISEILTNISTSVSGDLKGIISEAESICTLVKELEKINEEIEEQKNIISSNSGSSEEEVSKRNGAQRVINEKNSLFDTKHEEAKTKLAAIKTKDSEVMVNTEFVPSAGKIDPDKLQYGTFEQKEFTASNGLKVKYWLYVPDYGDEVEGLPCMLYMHGGSNHQSISYDHAVQYGLSNKILKKEITPSGVVIIPCVEDFSDKGVQALKELTDDVVDKQKCDTNRISVSGHSYGGITSYKLINKYPNYFSCCVPISGRSSVTDAFRNMKVWSFNGTYETGSSSTSYKSSVEAVKLINQVGGQATLTPLKTGHVGTNKDTYGKEYLSPDGIVENPLDWAFRQEKA